MGNQVHIIKGHLPEVLTVGKFRVKEPWIHRERYLDIHTMLLVTEGTVHISEDGVDYSVPAGHVFFFKAGSRQKGYRTIKTGTSWYWVSFSPDQSKGDEIELPKILGVTDSMRDAVERMERLYRRHSIYGDERLAGMLYSFFFELAAVEKKDAVQSGGRIAPGVLSVLDDQLETGYSSEEIAGALGMNYSYIGKCFKEETGQTIHQAFDRLKVERAKHLMVRGEMNISQVSQALGYPNPYYFSRVFKKVTGMSPRDYRKQMYL